MQHTRALVMCAVALVGLAGCTADMADDSANETEDDVREIVLGPVDGHDLSPTDLERVTAATEGFTGAEIEQVIVSALYTAFSERRALCDGHLLREITLTRPLSRTMGEKVAALREWARERTVPAN